MAKLTLYPIKYSIPTSSKVSLKLYDISGRCVKILVDSERIPGYYEETLETKNYAAGIYFYRIEAVPINRDFGSASTGDFKATRKLTILR